MASPLLIPTGSGLKRQRPEPTTTIADSDCDPTELLEPPPSKRIRDGPTGPLLALQAGRDRERRRLHRLSHRLATAMPAAIGAGAVELSEKLESFLVVRGVVPPAPRAEGAPNPAAMAASLIVQDARLLFNQQPGLMSALARRFCRVSPHLCFWLQEPGVFPGSGITDVAMESRVAAVGADVDVMEVDLEAEPNPIRDNFNEIARVPDGRYHPYATVAAMLSFFFWVASRLAVGTDRSGVDSYGQDTAERVISSMLSDAPAPCNHHREARCFLVSLLVSPGHYVCLWEKFRSIMAAAVETRLVPAVHLWTDPNAMGDALDDAGLLDLLSPSLAQWTRSGVDASIRHRMNVLSKRRQLEEEAEYEHGHGQKPTGDPEADPATLPDREYENRRVEDVQLPPPFCYGKFPSRAVLSEEVFAAMKQRSDIAKGRQCARTLPFQEEQRQHMLHRLAELMRRDDAPYVVRMNSYDDGDRTTMPDVVAFTQRPVDRSARVTIWGHSMQLPKPVPVDRISSKAPVANPAPAQPPPSGKCPQLLQRFLAMQEQEQLQSAAAQTNRAVSASKPASVHPVIPDGATPATAAQAPPPAAAAAKVAPTATTITDTTNTKKNNKKKKSGSGPVASPAPSQQPPRRGPASAWALTPVAGEAPLARWNLPTLAIPPKAVPLQDGTAPQMDERCNKCSDDQTTHNGECGPCVRCRHKSIYKSDKASQREATLPRGSAAVSADSVEAFLGSPTGRFVAAVLVAAERCGVRASNVPKEIPDSLARRIAGIIEAIGWAHCQVEPDRLTAEHKAMLVMFVGTDCHALSVPRILQCCNGCRDRRTMFCKFCVAAMGFAAPELPRPMMAIVLPKYPRIAKNVASSSDKQKSAAAAAAAAAKIQKNGPHFPNVACSRKCMESLLRDAKVDAEKLGALRPIHALYNAVVVQRFSRSAGALPPAPPTGVVSKGGQHHQQQQQQDEEEMEMDVEIPEDGNLGAWIEREFDLPELPMECDADDDCMTSARQEEEEEQQKDEEDSLPLLSEETNSYEPPDVNEEDALPVLSDEEDVQEYLPALSEEEDELLPVLEDELASNETVPCAPYEFTDADLP